MFQFDSVVSHSTKSTGCWFYTIMRAYLRQDEWPSRNPKISDPVVFLSSFFCELDLFNSTRLIPMCQVHLVTRMWFILENVARSFSAASQSRFKSIIEPCLITYFYIVNSCRNFQINTITQFVNNTFFKKALATNVVHPAWQGNGEPSKTLCNIGALFQIYTTSKMSQKKKNIYKFLAVGNLWTRT